MSPCGSRYGVSVKPASGAAEDRRGPIIRQVPFVEQRRVLAAWRSFEDIAEAPFQRDRRRLVHQGVEARPARDHERANIIDAMGVVGMRMREDDGVEPAHLGVEELLAQIRRGVDENGHRSLALARLEEQGAASAPVLRILRIAIAPIPANARHASRRAAAENGDAQHFKAAPSFSRRRSGLRRARCRLAPSRRGDGNSPS